MKLSEISKNIYIHAHHVGNTMWIDMFYVPNNMRRSGKGSLYYKKWEDNLPNNINNIQLIATDIGEGPSNIFWESLGFEYMYDDDNLDYLSKNHMIKQLK